MADRWAHALLSTFALNSVERSFRRRFVTNYKYSHEREGSVKESKDREAGAHVLLGGYCYAALRYVDNHAANCFGHSIKRRSLTSGRNGFHVGLTNRAFPENPLYFGIHLKQGEKMVILVVDHDLSANPHGMPATAP